MKLYAINHAGHEFQLLSPFFEALLPAFEDRAEEIRIEPDAAGSGLKLTYGDRSLSVPLPSPLYNYAGVAFFRILVLSGMNITLEGPEQTGVLKVRYNQQEMPIHVTSRREGGEWFLIFRPTDYQTPKVSTHQPPVVY